MPLSPWDWEQIQFTIDELAGKSNEGRRSRLHRWLRENAAFFIMLAVCAVVVTVFAVFVVPFWVEHWSTLQSCPTSGAVGC